MLDPLSRLGVTRLNHYFAMPIVSAFFGILIRMHYQEHGVPFSCRAPRPVSDLHFRRESSCRDWLDGPIFEPLKEPEYFRRFFIEAGDVGLAERRRYRPGNPL